MEPRSFYADDVDEASVIYNQVFYESTLEPVGRSRLPFRLDLKLGSAGPMTFATTHHSHETVSTVGGLDMTYTVAVPLKGAFPFRFGKTEVTADPSKAAIATPTSQVKFHAFHTGTEQLFILVFDRESMDSHLRKLLGRERTNSISLAPSLDLRRGPGAQWWQMASSLVLGLRTPHSLATNPLLTVQLSDAVMTGLLLAAQHPYRDDLDAWARPMPPSAIRRARDIIETRAHEALTIPDIAAEVGCSLRTLQTGYRTHYEMTPHEHLIRVRLDRAHALLRSATPATAHVAEIAALCGFGHPGRFASAYRKEYGVPPLVTLRKG